MPLSIIDCCDMSFRMSHVKYIHVSTHRRSPANAFTVVHFGLVVGAAAEEVVAVRTERQSAKRVSIKRFEVFKRSKSSVHRLKVPNLHLVIKGASDHLGPRPVDCNRLDRLGVVVLDAHLVRHWNFKSLTDHLKVVLI